MLDRARNFYGVISVRDWHPDQPDDQLVLSHGSINHGEQYLDPGKAANPQDLLLL